MKKEKETNTVTFRPNGGAKEVLNEWDETGYPRTTLINTLLSRHGKREMERIKRTLLSVGLTPSRKAGTDDDSSGFHSQPVNLGGNRLFSREMAAA